LVPALPCPVASGCEAKREWATGPPLAALAPEGWRVSALRRGRVLAQILEQVQMLEQVQIRGLAERLGLVQRLEYAPRSGQGLWLRQAARPPAA
jgi:hypothetical protein